MSLNIMVSGEVIQPPARKISNKGNRPMVTAALLVRPSDDTKLLVGVVAFGQAADVLERCSEGDTIAASGPARPQRWRGGEHDPLALQLLAKHVMVMNHAPRAELEAAVGAADEGSSAEEASA